MTKSEVAQLREDFVRERTKLLNRRVSASEQKLFDVIFKKVIEQFELDGGNIKASSANMDIANRLHSIWKEFQKGDYMKVIGMFAGDMTEIQSLNKIYFSILENDKAKIAKIGEGVDASINKRLGLNKEGKVIKNGFLDKLIKDESFLKDIKKQTYKAVTGGESLKQFTKRMSTVITGNKSVNGGLVRHFNTFAYDTYAAVDRTAQKLWAGKLGLKAFIYAGGKIKTSRLFCIKNNGKVFTTDEAKDWEDLIGEYDGPMWAEGTYEPLRDMGGHRCRHSPNFISNREAISRRPELASVLS